MTIDRETSLNYVTKYLYGKKDKLDGAVRSIFCITTIMALLLLFFIENHIFLGVYCVIDISILLVPKYLSKKFDYILPDALKWASLGMMPYLMMYSLYVFACENIGAIEYSSLFFIIPTQLIVAVFGLYLGLRKMSKTTTISKTLLVSASSGLSFWFYMAVVSFSRKLFKKIPLIISYTFLTCVMVYYLFNIVITLLYAVVKFKFTWSDIDATASSYIDQKR